MERSVKIIVGEEEIETFDQVKLFAPKKSVTCRLCSVRSANDTCQLAELEIELGRPPLTGEAEARGISLAKIPALFCLNGYTSPDNARIF